MPANRRQIRGNGNEIKTRNGTARLSRSGEGQGALHRPQRSKEGPHDRHVGKQSEGKSDNSGTVRRRGETNASKKRGCVRVRMREGRAHGCCIPAPTAQGDAVKGVDKTKKKLERSQSERRLQKGWNGDG